MLTYGLPSFPNITPPLGAVVVGFGAVMLLVVVEVVVSDCCCVFFSFESPEAMMCVFFRRHVCINDEGVGAVCPWQLKLAQTCLR